MKSHEADRLAAFAERQLDAEVHAEVAAHLERCADCRRALAQIERGIALATELAPYAMPPALAAAMRARLVRPSPPSRWSLPAIAALLILGVALSWQLNRPWARMRTAPATATAFEMGGRAMHAQLSRGERLDYVPMDDRDAWHWLALQRAPVAGLLPNHSATESPRFRVTGAGVRTVAGARASVVSYRVDDRRVTLILANSSAVPDAPAARWWSKSVHHRRDPDGANVLTWTIGGGTYVMVSELGDYGQRACFVCHTEPRFQSVIMSLQPD